MTQQRLGLTYELRTVEDFLTIPPDQLPHAMTDFLIWLRLLQAARASGMQPTEPGVFRWHDDGRHVTTIQIGDEVHEL